jgi:hypothetical protein
MSFTSFFAAAINKGAKLAKGPAEVAAHFDGLVAAAKVGHALDPAALDVARTAYKNLLESLPKGSARSEAERDFATEVVQAVGKDLDKKDAFMKALGADGIADNVLNAEAKAAKKGAQAADKVSQTLSGLTPKTTKVEDLDTSLGTLRTNLGKAGLIDANAATKTRAVKDIRGALEGGQAITQAEFTKFASGLRQESLVAERGRLVTQIERAASASDGRADAGLFDRLETLRTDKDYPKGKGASTNDALADLKAGRPVSDDSLTALRATHATGSNGLSAARRTEIVGDLDRTRLGLLDGLAVNRTSNFRMNTTEVFKGLREVLEREEHSLLLPRLNRAEVVSPSEVYGLLRRGEPISRDELNTLESFYRRHFDTATAPQPKGHNSASPQIIPGNTAAAGLQFAKGAFDSIMRYADNSGKSVRVSRNVLHEWETGAEPNIASRLANNLRDGSVGAWATAIPLAATTAFAGKLFGCTARSRRCWPRSCILFWPCL